MDQRLSDAAWTGNVEYLQKLLQDEPCILYNTVLVCSNTPLHIASMPGHLDFVKEIINLRPEFARELNQDGFSPLHIASANGHTEIVNELLKLDQTLCLIRGWEGRIPLQSAVIKGKVHVIAELLAATADCIESVTAQGETPLHLAVRNNQFAAFKILAEHLKTFNKEEIMNVKDNQGNTILHLAVSRKSYEVVEFMLSGRTFTDSDKIEVNSLNDRFLTPLDVLQLFQSETGDREIEEILKQAGALKATELDPLTRSSVSPRNSSNGQEQSRIGRDHPHQSPAKRLLEYFKYDKVNDSPNKVRNTLLVIAILIATATYQAVLSPPGGVWQDDHQNSTTSTASPASNYVPGKAIMGYRDPITYSLFLSFNSIGFYMSLHMIYILTAGFPMRWELLISMYALICTYNTCMHEMAPSSSLGLFFNIISGVLPLGLPIVSFLLRNYFKKPTRVLPSSITRRA